MNARPIFIVSFVVGAILVSSFLGWIAWKSHRQAEVDLAAADVSRRVELETLKALALAHQRTADAHAKKESLQKQIDSLRKASDPAQMQSETRVLPNTHSERLQKDPAYQQLWLADRRARLSGSYAGFFRIFKLGPAQIAQFENNLVAREEQTMDAKAAAQEKGLRDDDPVVIGMLADARARYESAQRALLGDMIFQELQTYDRTLVARGSVAGLCAAAVAAHAPLSTDQAERLTQAITQAEPNYQNGGEFVLARVDWAAVDREAATFLTAEQLHAIQTSESVSQTAGGRFFSRLNNVVSQALAKDAAAK